MSHVVTCCQANCQGKSMQPLAQYLKPKTFLTRHGNSYICLIYHKMKAGRFSLLQLRGPVTLCKLVHRHTIPAYSEAC